MCGLVASLRGDHSAALGRLLHRGVRHRTHLYKNGAAISHVRLPIVGVGGENDQPVELGPLGGSGSLAWVGEVLDFRETDPDLECDTTFVAGRWVERGPRALTDRDGFWHVVVLDPEAGTITAFCDYLAQKPLYFRSDEYAIAVASEPMALAVMGPTTPRLPYLSAAQKWGYCPEVTGTPWEQIIQVPPGGSVVLESVPGQIRGGISDFLNPLQPSSEELRTEIETAVRRRVLSSDVSVGCLVSGGLDSAITYTLARRHGSVVPFHAENGELDATLDVAPAFRYIYLRPDEIGLADQVRIMQEPVDLGSLAPQIALAGAIADARGVQINVCLTGDGAGELFGGYCPVSHYDSHASDVWHELVGWHLPRLDRAMMHRKIEVRSPFLARRVAEMALGLPRGSRADRKILRDLFRDDLPPGVADRPKRAFKAPQFDRDRQAKSIAMVEEFRRQAWPS